MLDHVKKVELTGRALHIFLLIKKNIFCNIKDN